MDIDQFRHADVALHGLVDADRHYTLYYDETNNVRRLHLTPKGLNVAEPGCFVLAGVGHPGDPRPIDIAPLRSALRLQPTTGELKLAHIGKGSFLDLLRSWRLGSFLDWVDASGLFLHYHALDMIYWSLVDIVDTALMATGRVELLLVAPVLKDMLNIALRRDIDATIDLLRLFGYPALDPRDGPHFYQAVRQMVAGEAEHLHPVYGRMLVDVLEGAVQGDSFPFIEGTQESRDVLVDGFDIFFRHRVSLLRNSTHILDLEEVVRREFVAHPLMRDGLPLDNFRFVDSREEPMIQVADAVAGLLGKFFSYIVGTELPIVAMDRAALDPIQRGNLAKLAGLIDRASDENPALAHRILSLSDDRKAGLFMWPDD